MYCAILPSGSVAVAEKFTVSGATPLLVLAPGEQVGGCPLTLDLRNHGVAVACVLKKASSSCATLFRPVVEGCVKSLCTSEHNQVNLSERGLVPSAQRYDAQASHGATTVPLLRSKFRLPTPFN